MFRMPIYEGSLPPFSIILVGAAISLVTLTLGWIYFSHEADKFAYIA
jgi:ABC-type polysaccharide/polyol phosphate export permease